MPEEPAKEKKNPEEKSPGDKAEKKESPKKTEKPAAKKKPKPLDPLVAETKRLEAQNRAFLDFAVRLSKKIDARLIFLIIENPGDCKIPESVLKKAFFVPVIKESFLDEDFRKQFKTALTLPSFQLSRAGKIKMAVMKSLSSRLIQQGDKIVCITGARGENFLDTVMVLDIGKEQELLSSTEVGNLSSQVRTEVFEQLVSIATELAHQGREGKPVGAIFVLGDTEKVMQLSRQLIFNPFQGYPEEERNILDPRLKETIKEFASIDGAFIIRDDGVIEAAGRHLNAVLEEESLPQGLGTRHAAAAGITDVTNATAIVISESTGTVRIFRNGKIFMEIEKPAPPSPRR